MDDFYETIFSVKQFIGALFGSKTLGGVKIKIGYVSMNKANHSFVRFGLKGFTNINSNITIWSGYYRNAKR